MNINDLTVHHLYNYIYISIYNITYTEPTISNLQIDDQWTTSRLRRHGRVAVGLAEVLSVGARCRLDRNTLQAVWTKKEPVSFFG